MRRILLLSLFAFVLLQTQGCFRDLLDKEVGEAFARGLMASLMRSTVRLFPDLDTTDSPGLLRVPFVPAPVGISCEPPHSPEELGYEPSPNWITLFEFGIRHRGLETGPGFKLQAPLPRTWARPGGWISFPGCGVRLFSTAWGPGWNRPRGPGITGPTPDRPWEDVFTRTHGWTGADGAATVALPGGRTLWLFGDTFIGPVRQGKHAEGTTMVNNTIAVSHTTPVLPRPDAVNFFWSTTADNKPAAWSIPDGTPQGERAEWFWPAGGGIGAPGPGSRDRLLVFMTKLGRRADAPKDSIWNFEARGTTLLTISNPKAEPAAWLQTQCTISPLLDEAGRQVTWGAAILPAGETWNSELYIVGIDSTNVIDKKMLLAHAPSASLERFDTWRFWNGADWSSRAAEAAPIVSPLASELSMHRLNLGDAQSPQYRYIMLYSELTLGPKVLCRTAATPEGPWSEPTTLYDCPEPAQDKKLIVYACKAHPELSRPGELLVSYCVNSTDFWDVIAHAEKYRPRFIRIPLSSIAAASQ